LEELRHIPTEYPELRAFPVSVSDAREIIRQKVSESRYDDISCYLESLLQEVPAPILQDISLKFEAKQRTGYPITENDIAELQTALNQWSLIDNTGRILKIRDELFLFFQKQAKKYQSAQCIVNFWDRLLSREETSDIILKLSKLQASKTFKKSLQSFREILMSYRKQLFSIQKYNQTESQSDDKYLPYQTVLLDNLNNTLVVAIQTFQLEARQREPDISLLNLLI
jgi:hypothetical protein